MIEWIIFIVIALVISEILFFTCGNEEEWILSKMVSLVAGTFGGFFLFLLPFKFAYYCESLYGEGVTTCTNYGIQVFYWLYGIIGGLVLFFLVNGWLLKKMRNRRGEKWELKK